VNTLRYGWELGGNTFGTSKFKTSKSMLGNYFDFSKNHWLGYFLKIEIQESIGFGYLKKLESKNQWF
jgi:hypothetical protein